jgi:hypothetical protein
MFRDTEEKYKSTLPAVLGLGAGTSNLRVPENKIKKNH